MSLPLKPLPLMAPSMVLGSECCSKYLLPDPKPLCHSTKIQSPGLQHWMVSAAREQERKYTPYLLGFCSEKRALLCSYLGNPPIIEYSDIMHPEWQKGTPSGPAGSGQGWDCV